MGFVAFVLMLCGIVAVCGLVSPRLIGFSSRLHSLGLLGLIIVGLILVGGDDDESEKFGSAPVVEDPNVGQPARPEAAAAAETPTSAPSVGRWVFVNGVAGVYGEHLVLGVACVPQGPAVSIRFRNDGAFGNGLVIASFDDELTIDAVFSVRDSQLNALAVDGPGQQFLGALRRANRVVLGVRPWGASQSVVDTIGLSGSGAAIGELPCV